MIFSVSSLFAKKERDPEHIYIESQFTRAFIKEVEKEFGLHCYGCGGGMPRDVQTISLDFYVKKTADVGFARSLLIALIGKFTNAINAYEPIRPYLREYPFPTHRISISLMFPPTHKPDEVELAFQSLGSLLYFNKDINKKYVDLGYETYPEAVAKEHSAKTLPSNTLRTGDHPRPSDFTAGYNKEFDEIESKRPPPVYRDLRPLSEEEILGIKNIDQSNLSAVIEELIDGFYTPGFDKAFFEHVAQVQKEHPNEHYVEYWDNGKKKWEATFTEGVPDGHFHGWYYHGQEAFKGFHRKGVRIGPHMGFFWSRTWMFAGDDSVAYAREFYYNAAGMRDGEQAIYHEVGRLLCVARYKKGLLHGEVIGYGIPREPETLYRSYKHGKLMRDKRKK